MLSLCLHNVCIYSESFDTVFKYFAIRNPETPPSTPQRHRDRLRRQEQDARVMHTPQHRRLPAQLSHDDPFVVNAPLAGGIPTPPSTNDPFVGNAPVAGGTWQLPLAPVNPPLLSIEDIRTQANFHAQTLHDYGRGRGRGRGCGRGGDRGRGGRGRPFDRHSMTGKTSVTFFLALQMPVEAVCHQRL